MGLKIYWTLFAENELKNIFDYYKKEAGLRVARKLILGIQNELVKLLLQPELGQQEELLKSRPENFRYLVYKSYKIIYWVNISKSRIEIIDVFDTRQNPIKMDRNR